MQIKYRVDLSFLTAERLLFLSDILSDWESWSSRLNAASRREEHLFGTIQVVCEISKEDQIATPYPQGAVLSSDRKYFKR